MLVVAVIDKPMLSSFMPCFQRTRAAALSVLCLALAGCGHWWVGPDPLAWRWSASAGDQFEVFQSVMGSPGRVPALVQSLSQQAASAPPEATWGLVSALSARRREAPQWRLLPDGVDTLAAPSLDAQTLQALQSLAQPLRGAVVDQLQAMQRAQAALDGALLGVPKSVTRQRLLGGQVDARQLAALAPMVHLPALAQGMQDVLNATRRLSKVLHALEHAGQLTPVVWRYRAQQGWVHIDTTGLTQTLAPEDVWLWIKTGGDDDYRMDRFHGDSDRRAVRVLIDTGGHDRYQSQTAGADASAGVLGLSVLWDGGGNDDWQCTQWCQGAAWLGAAALINSGGRDVLQAQTQAQAYALGGLALLASMSTDQTEALTGSPIDATRYTALSDAQGSAGPSGVALLLDTHGDDRYTLAALPLVAPSAQLPERNRSTGQGMGLGWRQIQDGREVLATAGGVGVLIDLQGNDHYSAQVFAQGAGYHEGLGLLIDGDGHNTHEAAWYALGAAAHGGAGVFVASGKGDDVYRISQVTALGAGHDAAVGWFEDRGGNDRYALGDMGLGMGSDGGSGFFLDRGGTDCFEGQAALARVQGRRVWLQHPQGLRAGVAVFRHAGQRRCGQLRP